MLKSIALQITWLVMMATYLQAQEAYLPANLGPMVNSPYSEIGPIISPDGKTLFFHRSNHPENGYGAGASQDIWFSELDQDNNWSKAQRMPEALNNGQYNSLKGVTPDGITLLVEGAFEDGKYMGRGLSFSLKTESGWSKPQKLEILNYKQMAVGIYSSSSLSNDSKTLIMAFSEVKGSNFDDLYFSHLLEDSTWSQPKRLGDRVNTRFTETTPFIASDGSTIYFSSNRPGGQGSNDIYYTKRLDDTWENWTEPANMGPTVNTSAWEAYYSIDASAEFAYLVSNRNSLGKSDIVKVRLGADLQPDPVVLIYGKVFNSKTKNPVEANIKYEILPGGRLAGSARSDRKGNYKIVLPYGEKYGFLAQSPNFIAVSDYLDLTEVASYQELERDLFLVPFEVGETIRLNNIFFDFGKSILRPESFPELKRVGNILQEDPDFRIEVGGHTDDVGTHQDNIALSNARAQAVKDYLVGLGIDRDRINSVGYGETRPAIANNSQANRQLNRRVEFKILEK